LSVKAGAVCRNRPKRLGRCGGKREALSRLVLPSAASFETINEKAPGGFAGGFNES